MRKLIILTILFFSNLAFSFPVNKYFLAQIGQGSCELGFDSIFSDVSLKASKDLTARVGFGVEVMRLVNIEGGIGVFPSSMRIYQNAANNSYGASKINNIYGADIMVFLNLFNLEFGAGYAVTNFNYGAMRATDQNQNVVLEWDKSKKYFVDPKIEARFTISLDSNLSLFVSAAHLFGLRTNDPKTAQYQPGINTITLGVKF